MLNEESQRKTSPEKVESIHKFLAYFNLFIAVAIVLALILFGVFRSETKVIDAILVGIIFSLIPFFISIIHFITARGVRNNKGWARVVSFIIGFVILFYFPIGTIFGAILLYLTTKGWAEITSNELAK